MLPVHASTPLPPYTPIYPHIPRSYLSLINIYSTPHIDHHPTQRTRVLPPHPNPNSPLHPHPHTLMQTTTLPNGLECSHPTLPMPMAMLDSMSVHTKMSLIHEIVRHVIRQSKINNAVSKIAGTGGNADPAVVSGA